MAANPRDLIPEVWGNANVEANAKADKAAANKSKTGGRAASAAVAAPDRAAAKNLGTIARFNAQSTRDQLGRSLGTFGLADKQNRDLAKVELTQAGRQSANDRFSQLKKLQSSARGLFGSSGNAMDGSGLDNLAGMLQDRNDSDSGEVLGTLTQNRGAIGNSLNEALNANVLARRGAASDAAFAVRGIEADTATNLNNISPKLFVKPGTKSANMKSKNQVKTFRKVKANKPKINPYIIPAGGPSVGPQGSSYFDKLVNSYNSRPA